MKSVYKFIPVPALLSPLGATSFAQPHRRTDTQSADAGNATVTLAVSAQE
jgi:hypothetical protein